MQQNDSNLEWNISSCELSWHRAFAIIHLLIRYRCFVLSNNHSAALLKRSEFEFNISSSHERTKWIINWALFHANKSVVIEMEEEVWRLFLFLFYVGNGMKINGEPTWFLMLSSLFSNSIVRFRSAMKSLFSIMRVCSSRASLVSAVWRTSDTLTEF